jgi:hypothetical protein
MCVFLITEIQQYKDEMVLLSKMLTPISIKAYIRGAVSLTLYRKFIFRYKILK